MLTRLLRRYTKPYWVETVAVFILILLQTLGNLSLPSLNADMINQGVALGDTEYVLQKGSQMLGISFGLLILTCISVYLASKTSMLIARDLRRDIFGHVLRLSPAEMDHFGTPSLITRNTNDVTQVQVLLTMGLTMLASAPITVIGGVIMALRHSVRMSLIIAAAMPLMMIVIYFIQKRAVPGFRQVQKRIDRINAVFREQITGVRVIRAFVRDDSEKQRFAVANGELMETQLSMNRLFAIAMPSLTLVLNLATIAIIWFGGRLINADMLQIGDLTAFISYLMQILGSVMMAIMMLILIPRATASAERIMEVLDHEPLINESPLARPQINSGTIEFRNVSYQYPGAEEPVLRNLNFSLKPGEVTAVVGSTGSGKTTLVNLVMRFVDATSGQVLINGVDVRQQPLKQLWDAVGFVPQRPYLFQGTIRDAVAFGQELSDEELWKALDIAQASDFVNEIAEKLDAPVAQGGTNFSGGQRQRLSIARALARKSHIFVFDDSFSALDAGTDARLRNALLAETKEATVLLVAQRISSVMTADRIIVIDEGRIAGMGTHSELLASCRAYQEIVQSQRQLEVGA